MRSQTHPVKGGSPVLRPLFSGFIFAFLLMLLILTGLKFRAGLIRSWSVNPLETYRRVVKIDPSDAVCWFKLGKIYSALGEYGKAKRAYDEALSWNQLYYPVWKELMWFSLNQKQNSEWGNSLRLIKIIDTLNPTDVTGHWDILLRMLTIDEAWSREAALREIRLLFPLSRGRENRLFRIASLILGDADKLVDFVPKDRELDYALLRFLLFSEHRPVPAMDLWERMKARGWTDDDNFRTMIRGLFGCRDYETAWSLWIRRYRHAYDENLIYNGGFERRLKNYGFSWRYRKKGRGIKRARCVHFYKEEGRKAFSIKFDGEHNPDVTNPYQYIYLYPGTYKLTAYLSTRDLTGASGFFVEFTGPHFRLASPQRKGDTDWEKFEVVCRLKSPGLYRIALRRRATGKLNRFLGGEVFLDDVSLVRVYEKKGP